MIQNRAIRNFLGIQKFAPVAGMRGEMEWYSPIVGRHLNICRLWNRLINMPESRLTRVVFEQDFNLCSRNWSAKLLHLLEMLNMDNYFHNKMALDIDKVYAK